jgi:hypothetical protein
MRILTNAEARMRDGVVLRGDVFQPDEGDRFPTLLVRTPYSKADAATDPYVVGGVARGYAVVVQDVRGRYASAGEFDAYRNEGRDGYDSVEWAAAQPWSNGKVGMAGLSYPGAVQWLAAVEAPPHLACIFPAMCFSSGRQFFYFGGAFDLSWIPWIAVNIAPDTRRRRGLPGPATVADARAAFRREAAEAYRHVPLSTLPLVRDVAPCYYDWLDHPDDGSYWEFANIEARHDRVQVPSFNFSGWHDEGYGPSGATRNFAGMRRRGRTERARTTRLVIGPWTHGAPSLDDRRVGDRDFGAAAGLDYYGLVLDWCDWHLRGIDHGLETRRAVRLFVMGANEWREADDWPPAGADHRHLYLRARGALSWQAPATDETPDTFVFDPRQPLEDPHHAAGLGPHDQRAIEARPDMLVYSTPPIEEDLEVIGPLEFRLWVSSDAPDTDLVARLIDVAPDGTAWNLMSPTLEVLRLRYRDGEDRARPLEPGRVYEVRLRLGLTANRFLRGHRIRVHVTSSFFPHLDRNPNTGRPSAVEGRLVPARQRVFHDPPRPSHIVLPVSGSNGLDRRG